MKELPVISVIVPIYNTEKYLRKCVDSIINNTYKNLDVILLDDGSTDVSPSICDEYAAADDRIRAIHQKNSGLVASRQIGIKLSKGEWIAFVDSDDYIETDTYERMMESALQYDSDIVWCALAFILPNEKIRKRIAFSSNASVMLSRLLNCTVPGWIWTKITKKSFYDSVDIQVFPKDSMYEDVLLSAELLLANPKMSYVDVPLYNYNRTNEEAMTAFHKEDIVYKAVNNIQHTYDYICSKGQWSKYAHDFSYLAMTVKLPMLINGDYDKAKSLFPFAHKILKAYRMSTPVSWIYWMGFNMGLLGKTLIKLYLHVVK